MYYGKLTTLGPGKENFNFIKKIFIIMKVPFVQVGGWPPEPL
jgi:hypothetical protein